MSAKRPPQPTRFAIQKARGKGWKTLEVGEDLDHAKARFDVMVGVNPRAYFRLIQLDYNADSGYEGMEFNWTLIELHDPTRKAAPKPASKPSSRPSPRPARRAVPGARPVRRREAVALPFRVYLAVVLVGALVGGLAYLHFVGAGR